MVNDGLDVPLDKKVRKINCNKMGATEHLSDVDPIYSIETLHTVQHRKGFPIFISQQMPINVHKSLALHSALHNLSCG